MAVSSVVECVCTNILQITQVLGSGTALKKNPVLQKCTESVFGVPLTIVDGVDAPKGAAIAVKTLT